MSTLKLEHISNISSSGNDLSIDTNGNLGIGTETPGEKLVVHGDGARLAVESADYEVAMLGRRGSSGAALDRGYLRLRKDGVTDDGVVIDTDGASFFQGGNVGVGTTNPADKMHIYNASGTTVYKAEVNANSIVGFGILKTGSTNQEWAIADGITANGKLQFYDSTDSAVRMQIDGSGFVGIGPNTPTDSSGFGQALDVNGTDGAALYLRDNTDSKMGVIGQWNDELSIHSKQSGGTIGFYINNGNKMTIDSDGDVGIGTATPASKLNVVNNGVNYAQIGTSYSGHYFESQSWDNYDGFEIYQQHGSNTTRNSFIVNDNRTGSKTAAFVVRGDGNVGISVDDPTDKLTLTAGNGGGILQSTYYNGTVTSGQKMGVIGFKGYSQGNTVAGADAKIEGVADGSHSGSSAPARLDFYVKDPAVGPGSGAPRRMQLTSYGELMLQEGPKGWASFYMNEDAGIRYHAKRFYTGSSSVTQNVMRVKRHYWGSGFYKISVKQQYYSSVTEQNFYLVGHGRNDGSYSPSYNLVFSDVYNGASGRLSITAPQSGAPGNSAANYVDVQISIPAYTHWVVVVEAGGQPSYSQDVTVMGGNDMYALH